MTDQRNALPHHRLVAYQCSLELLRCIRDAQIRDTHLRDQAMRAAKSAALNIAEAYGRVSPADRRRVFAIARGEATEAAAAIEIATLAGDAAADAFERCLPIASRLIALLTGLCR